MASLHSNNLVASAVGPASGILGKTSEVRGIGGVICVAP